ncbi:LysR family transcriptional regulator [Hyphomicrobium methylovorum]|nr:LysR family transcriptional regulator [Hyphomicrobium methylovorum]MBA2127003.1 LysR family transcriptional regulator [Hyphomicrobium methylovorum]
MVFATLGHVVNLQQLRYFRALVEEGSFVAAAGSCAVTQPTLSNGIAQLEAELGQRIFRRTTRSLSLTPAGERLLPAVLETLNAFEKIKELAKQKTQKPCTLQVGVSPVVGIRQAEDALEAFRKIRPDVNVIYREGNLQDLSDALRRAELDLILSPLDSIDAQPADCIYQLLCSEPLMFLPKKSEKARWHNRSEVSVSDIADETFVFVPNICGLTHVIKRIFETENLTIKRYAGEASSYSVIEEWASLGLGCAILPASKVSFDTNASGAIPIKNNGKPVMIDYFALGKPNTVPPDIFSDIWNNLNPLVLPTNEEDSALDWVV